MIPQTIVELEMLIQLYWDADYVLPKGVAHHSAMQRLLLAGMCKDLPAKQYILTEKGKFYVEHVMTTPYPEVTYFIPKIDTKPNTDF